MRLCRSQPRLAIESYTRAMEAQSQYANLYHISWWEIAGATLALWDIPASLEYWRKLQAEASWSKACYTVCCTLGYFMSAVYVSFTLVWCCSVPATDRR